MITSDGATECLPHQVSGARLREQLDRVLARELRRRRAYEAEALVRRVWQAWLALLPPKAAAAMPAAVPPAAAVPSTDAPARSDGPREEAPSRAFPDGLAVHGDHDSALEAALAASRSREAALTAELEARSRELEEVTMQLIMAKLGQAELETANQSLALNVKNLHKQVEVGMAGTDDLVEVPYAQPPSKARGANGNGKANGKSAVKQRSLERRD
jgi:hypothetical protein